MVNRVVVGAHYGLAGWLMQRVTAVVMALYSIFLAVALLIARPSEYAGWKAFLAQGAMRIATMIFFASVFLHAWIGVRDILMDYVKPAGVRLLLHVLVILALAGYAAWAAQILWRA
jgi:succinate dehydrogenase / fumarate reductase membrane anchor subunit